MAIENCQKMGLTHNGLEIRDSVRKSALAGGFASALEVGFALDYFFRSGLVMLRFSCFLGIGVGSPFVSSALILAIESCWIL